MQTNILRNNSGVFNKNLLLLLYKLRKFSVLDNVRETRFLIQTIKLEIALRVNTAGMLQYRKNKKNSLTTSVTTSKAA